MSLASLNSVAQTNIDAVLQARQEEEQRIITELEDWLSANRDTSLAALDELAGLCSATLSTKITKDDCSTIGTRKSYEVTTTLEAGLASKIDAIIECERCLRIFRLVSEYNTTN